MTCCIIHHKCMAFSPLFNLFWILGARPVHSMALRRSNSIRTEVAISVLNPACCACMLGREWFPCSWRGTDTPYWSPSSQVSMLFLRLTSWLGPGLLKVCWLWVSKLLRSYTLYMNLYLPTLKDLLAPSYSNSCLPLIACFCCLFSWFLRQVFTA